MIKVSTILLVYFLAVNLLGLAMMGIDKLKAKRRGLRISEATLFLIAIIGGSIGSILGMYLFRHKTKHRSFVFGMPAILILQLGILIFLCFGPLEIHTI